MLCPAALEALGDAAGGYAPRAALAAGCAELERALSDRFTFGISLEVNLGSARADDALADLDIGASSDEAERSRVAELLIECLVSRPPSGALVPDRRDVHQLLDLASAAMYASMDAQYAFAAIRSAELEISEYGHVDIEPTGAATANVRASQQEQLEDRARSFTAS